MKKRLIKKTALVNANPYLQDPKARETATVLAVSTGNRMEGIKVTRSVTRQHYRLLTVEAEGSQES